MIRVCGRTEQWRQGYIALTDAAKHPLLVHVDAIERVSFEFDGGQPSAVSITHRVGERWVETIVFEVLDEVVALMVAASAELAEEAF